MDLPEQTNLARTTSPPEPSASDSGPMQDTARPAAKATLINSVDRVMKCGFEALQRYISGGSPALFEHWSMMYDLIPGPGACCTKEPLGGMACSCRIAEEFASYSGINDLAFGGTGQLVINEFLIDRQEKTDSSGAWSLELSFIPCEVCRGTTTKIVHTIRQDPSHPARTCYTRTEIVIINNQRYFMEPTFENKSIYQIHLDFMAAKVEALANIVETIYITQF